MWLSWQKVLFTGYVVHGNVHLCFISQTALSLGSGGQAVEDEGTESSTERLTLTQPTAVPVSAVMAMPHTTAGKSSNVASTISYFKAENNDCEMI